MVGVARQVGQRAGLHGDPLPRRGKHPRVGIPDADGPAATGNQSRDLAPHRASADDRDCIQLAPRHRFPQPPRSPYAHLLLAPHLRQ